jgi:hypothetical protein
MNRSARQVVAVLGAHRSGTSVVARSLMTLGVSLGDRLMPADRFNERGYWEDLDIFRLNEDVLSALGHSWRCAFNIPTESFDWLSGTVMERRAVALLAARLGHDVPFGMKDPRTAMLMPFWRKAVRTVGAEASFVIVARHPDSVAASLARRYRMPPAWGHWLWIFHMLASIKGSEGCRRTVVPYPAIVVEPEQHVRRMASALGLDVDEAAMDEFRREFLDSQLVRAPDASVGQWTADCPQLAREIYSALDSAATGAAQLELCPALVAAWHKEAMDSSVAFHMAGCGLPRAPHRQQQPQPIEGTQWLIPRILGRLFLSPRRIMWSARILRNMRRAHVIDEKWYMATHPSARRSGVGARLHFATWGAFEGLVPQPGLEPDVYVSHRPHVAAKRMPASLHFALHGHRDPPWTWGHGPW